ncbi:hypothetical protein SDC9_147320 [bioreactor metagenome]|uniref:Uncharacterized protein n=1 Tax=bioreactor metagenome TaxID=1076179 RepID=A0A645EFD8_9ZZZZ
MFHQSEIDNRNNKAGGEIHKKRRNTDSHHVDDRLSGQFKPLYLKTNKAVLVEKVHQHPHQSRKLGEDCGQRCPFHAPAKNKNENWCK